MKQNFSLIYKVILLCGDIFALLLSFTLAYIMRVSLDSRPIAHEVDSITFISFIVILLPLWLGAFALLGLYSKRYYERRPKEAARLLLGSAAGILLMVSFDFFSNETIFPAKLIPIYAAATSFMILWMVRTVLRFIRLYLHKKHIGVSRVLLVGNNYATYYIAKYLHNNPSSGMEVVGIVANKSHVFAPLSNLQYRSITAAIEESTPHTIVHTHGEDTAKIYNLAIEHHLDYEFIPDHSALFTSRHNIGLLGSFPVIQVQTTPLIGSGRLIKRLMDIACSILGLILLSPLLLVIAIVILLSDPKGGILFRQKRLSRFKKSIFIYKFRTMKKEYSGMSPEEAFTKMKRPDLTQEYRKNGDQLDSDPRVSTIGKILRKTSLDELPQLINVLRGDISLVGPRALVPAEIEEYEYKSLILSVKSGLTGLAQISGRRDISFAERRKLDMYYVQNWSIWLDIQIIISTIYTVLVGRGAK